MTKKKKPVLVYVLSVLWGDGPNGNWAILGVFKKQDAARKIGKASTRSYTIEPYVVE